MKDEIQKWIGGDESAGEMLSRVSSVRPFVFPPPLHRVPLRVGNVVELVGPSPSGKTHILIHAAITSLLPKPYGGLDHLVVFLDLDSRFDITRFSQLLIHRITQHGGATEGDYDKTLYDLCMARFLYVRCSDSFEFLRTLRTLHGRLEKEKEVHGVGVHLLMIDSIGAYHWMDRASMFLSQRENGKKKLFLQTVSEAVVHNIRKLLQVYPMLIIATKSVIFGNKYSTASNEIKGNMEERCSKYVTRNHQNFQYREYMPSVWQSFVTHRILVRSSDDHPVTTNYQDSSSYLLEWLLPRLSFSDKIVVKDVKTRLESLLIHEARVAKGHLRVIHYPSFSDSPKELERKEYACDFLIGLNIMTQIGSKSSCCEDPFSSEVTLYLYYATRETEEEFYSTLLFKKD